MSGIADQIRELSLYLEGADIQLLELENRDGIIRLQRDISNQNLAQVMEADTVATEIPSPSVGVFRRAHPLRTAPLAEPGRTVTAGDPVGLLQIGALLVHVAAPKDGIILAVLAEDGATVGYGTPLLRFIGSGE